MNMTMGENKSCEMWDEQLFAIIDVNIYKIVK